MSKDYLKYREPNYDMLMRIVLVGDSAVGKSSLLERYVDEKFRSVDTYLSTIGVDFRVRIADIHQDDVNRMDLVCKVQVWDTAGQERFRSITQSYYRNARACLICFDCSKHNQFEGSIQNVSNWIEDIRHVAANIDSCMIYIIGTMMDECNRFGTDIHDPNTQKFIDEWQANKNVKFIGWCSSKTNEYQPYVPEYSNNTNNFKVADNQVYSIDQMFKYIVQDCTEMLNLKDPSNPSNRSDRTLKSIAQNIETNKNNKSINLTSIDSDPNYNCCLIL